MSVFMFFQCISGLREYYNFRILLLFTLFLFVSKICIPLRVRTRPTFRVLPRQKLLHWPWREPISQRVHPSLSPVFPLQSCLPWPSQAGFLLCAYPYLKSSWDSLPGNPEMFCNIDIREPVSAQDPEFELFFICRKEHIKHLDVDSL